jgi:hypothetical protein
MPRCQGLHNAYSGSHHANLPLKSQFKIDFHNVNYEQPITFSVVECHLLAGLKLE